MLSIDEGKAKVAPAPPWSIRPIGYVVPKPVFVDLSSETSTFYNNFRESTSSSHLTSISPALLAEYGKGRGRC